MSRLSSLSINQVRPFLQCLGIIRPGNLTPSLENWQALCRIHRCGHSLRLLLIPDSLKHRSTTFIASSRLGRTLDEFPNWFEGLRNAAVRLDPEADGLVTAEGTTTDRFVIRIGTLFQIPVYRCKPFPPDIDVNWIEDWNNSDTVWFSPAIEAEHLTPGQPDPSFDFPLADIADQMLVLRASAHGNILKATLRRLNGQPDNTNKPTTLLVDTHLTRQSVSDQLLDNGARGWWLYHSQAALNQPGELANPKDAVTHSDKPDKPAPTTDSQPPFNLAPSANPAAKLLKIEELSHSDFLTHWTRVRNSRWPDQSEQDYLDELIFGCNQYEPNGCSALLRILASQRLVASNQLTRGPHPVNCWTAVPLPEYRKRRVFRRHLGRWDFEPFGIGIRKTWLVENGARPVIYGDEDLWENLPIDDRPFFQSLPSTPGTTDWREEKEWRLIHDLDLKFVGPNDGFVFVENDDYARKIQPFSRWPVVVLAHASSPE